MLPEKIKQSGVIETPELFATAQSCTDTGCAGRQTISALHSNKTFRAPVKNKILAEIVRLFCSRAV
jgi:hypothetical protein